MNGVADNVWSYFFKLGTIKLKLGNKYIFILIEQRFVNCDKSKCFHKNKRCDNLIRNRYKYRTFASTANKYMSVGKNEQYWHYQHMNEILFILLFGHVCIFSTFRY
jgi:hypothetical protein